MSSEHIFNNINEMENSKVNDKNTKHMIINLKNLNEFKFLSNKVLKEKNPSLYYNLMILLGEIKVILSKIKGDEMIKYQSIDDYIDEFRNPNKENKFMHLLLENKDKIEDIQFEEMKKQKSKSLEKQINFHVNLKDFTSENKFKEFSRNILSKNFEYKYKKSQKTFLTNPNESSKMKRKKNEATVNVNIKSINIQTQKNRSISQKYISKNTAAKRSLEKKNFKVKSNKENESKKVINISTKVSTITPNLSHKEYKELGENKHIKTKVEFQKIRNSEILKAKSIETVLFKESEKSPSKVELPYETGTESKHKLDCDLAAKKPFQTSTTAIKIKPLNLKSSLKSKIAIKNETCDESFNSNKPEKTFLELLHDVNYLKKTTRYKYK